MTLSRNNANIAEAAGTSVYTATLSAVSGRAVTVNLGFGGTARLTSDYTRTGSRIIIAPGAKSGSITVTAVQDSIDEPLETIVVDIVGVTCGSGLGPQKSSSMIIDDDPSPAAG